jgi:hypothetical protein
VDAWVGCVAGSLHEDDYRAKLAEAGFTAIEIEETRVYDMGGGNFFSAFVRAKKPAV